MATSKNKFSELLLYYGGGEDEPERPEVER